jgi:nucleoside-diphosphate-sugar epimerase
VSRILITGAGYVGAPLAARLHAQGHTVFGLRRDAGQLPTGVMGLNADVGKPDTLAILPDQIEYLVYCVAPDASTPSAYALAYVQGLHNVLQGLKIRSSPPKRVLFTSSTAVYSQANGEWVDEATPAAPRHFSGQALLEAEQLLAQTGLPYVVVRLGGIYGPGRSRLIETVRSGTVNATGAEHYTNRIHRDDCVGVLHHLLFLPDAARLYLGVDHCPASYLEVVTFVAECLGLPPPSLLNQRVAPPGRRLRSNKRCSNARLRDSGYVFTYPSFREGYQDLLQESANAR